MQIMELLQSSGGISAIAGQLGLSEAQAQAGASALLPAILGGFKKPATSSGPGALTDLLSSSGGAQLLENLVSSAPTNSNLGVNVLQSIFGSKEVSRSVADRASQSAGLNTDTLKQMLPLLAMAATGVLAKQSGAGAASGGALGQLGKLVGGGEGAAGLSKLLDMDGDGNPLDDIVNMAGKFFGR